MSKIKSELFKELFDGYKNIVEMEIAKGHLLNIMRKSESVCIILTLWVLKKNLQ